MEINHIKTEIDFESCEPLIATLRLVWNELLHAGNSQEKPVKYEQDTAVEKLVATQHCMPSFMKRRRETTYWVRDRARAINYGR